MKRKVPKSIVSILVYFFLSCSSVIVTSSVFAQSVHEIIFAHDFENNTLGDYREDEMKSDWNHPSWANHSLGYGIIEENSGNKYLKIPFPEGHFFLESGVQWHCVFDKGYNELYLTYRVKFSSGFVNENYCGKLPGLSGGTSNGAGDMPDGTDGWSARYMFHGTKLSFYLYHPEIYKNSYYNDPEPVEGKKYYGDGLTLNASLETGKWYTVTQRIVMNTVGSHNGLVEGYINGKLVAQRGNMLFRTTESLKIDRIFFSNFFGGSGIPAEQLEHIYFDDFYAYTFTDEAGVIKGNRLSSSDRILTEPLGSKTLETVSVIGCPTFEICQYNLTNDSIYLEWLDNSDNEQGFEIYKSVASNNGFDLVSTTSSNVNNYTDFNDDENNTVFYKIRAFNQDATSSFSNVLTPQLFLDDELSAPSDIIANAIGHDRIQLNWSHDTAAATGILIERSDSENGNFSVVDIIDNKHVTYVDTGLAMNTTKYYRIKSVKSKSVSNPGNIVNATTIAWEVNYVPNVPTEISVEEISGNGVLITWKDESTVESFYTIERAESAKGPFITVCNALPNSISYHDFDLDVNGTYYYRLAGVNHIGSSDYSDVYSIQVGNNDATNNTNSSLILKDASIHINENPENGQHVLNFGDYTEANNLSTISYSFISGNESNIFQIQPNSDSLLINDNTHIDYENKKSFDIAIKAFDSNNETLIDSAIYSFIINDVNEAPGISDRTFSLYNNQTRNDLIGNVKAYDPDFNQSLSYDIIDGNQDNIFKIDAQGNILLNKDLIEIDNYTLNNGFTLVVEVKDNGQNMMSNQASIKISFNTGNAPSILKLNAKPLSMRKAVLEWDDIHQNSDSVILQRCIGNGFEPIDTLALNTKIFFDETLYPGVSCKYKIEAILPNGESVLSNTAYVYMPSEDSSGRVNKGLMVLYKFDEGDGFVVNDQSGTDKPLDLFIDNPSNIVWVNNGGVAINKNTIIRSELAANKIINACKSSNEITLEAWILPSEVEQYEPARILTISKDNYERGATLDQVQDYGNKQHSFLYSTSLISENSEDNSLSKFTMQTNLKSTVNYHLVYTRDNAGHEKFYLNGELVEVGFSPYDFANWSDNYLLAIGNEITQNRPWLGTIYLAAIYNLALNPEQVEKNFLSGYGASKVATGIENNIPLDVQVYPNPAKDWVKVSVNNLNINNINIQLMDVSGRLVNSVNISGDGFGEHKMIDVSSISPGMYVLQITDINNNRAKNIRIIKN